MYSLQLTCKADQVDTLSGELWETHTSGIRELTNGESTTIIAFFETNEARDALLERFSSFSPGWTHEPDTDWLQETQRSWPGRRVGSQFFLAAPWCEEPTPVGRLRLVHNPGLACGTGEHPCTRLALEALEKTVTPGCSVADVGTGSALLAIAALRLGATNVFGLDHDEAALQAAQQNFKLNDLPANLVAGSADCLAGDSVDVVLANINATVLLALADDFLTALRSNGILILTGFPDNEVETVKQAFPPADVSHQEGWTCIISRISSPA
jgi:ribosomal protein L11 methyltransferase